MTPLSFFDLSDAGLLKISGPDAKKLLQGQLTCDVEKMIAGKTILGAHCNPQGRIISLFRLFVFQQAYFLLMPINMVPIALAALKKYAAFYKCEVIDVSNQFAITGLTSTPTNIDLTDEMGLIEISTTLPQVLIGTKEAVKNTLSRFSNKSTIPSYLLRYFDIQIGIPAIYPETTGKFLPHDLNLPELNAISFAKGCYTGQEIIARMQYRGKLKNRMYKASINSSKPLLPGQDIYAIHDNKIQPSGIVIDSYQDEKNNYQTLLMLDKLNAKNNFLFLDQDQAHFFTIID